MTVDGQQIAQLQQEIEELRSRLAALTVACGSHPPGHFYSPIPGAADIALRAAEIRAGPLPRSVPGIDLADSRQLENLRAIGAAIEYSPPFPETRSEAFRYYYENHEYSYTDAITLHGMLRRLKPKRLIEIGSGFSSAVMLDTNERYLGGSLSFTFIEPYTERLELVMRDGDREQCRIYQLKVQDVDLDVFKSLEAGDVLFIDSSHVVKFGSDVEYIFREVLPVLTSGVYIHFHDIVYPFEYLAYWVDEEGLFWNECYMLRAFLSNNNAYQIELFINYLTHFYRDELEAVSPLCLRNTGANLWLSKIANVG